MPQYFYTQKLTPHDAIQMSMCGPDSELQTVKYEFNNHKFIVHSLFNYV